MRKKNIAFQRNALKLIISGAESKKLMRQCATMEDKNDIVAEFAQHVLWTRIFCLLHTRKCLELLVFLGPFIGDVH